MSDPLEFEIPDRYKDLVLHSDRVDWNDPELTADSISSQFMGTHSYWHDEDFDDIEGDPLYPEIRFMNIEREILLEQGRDNWHETTFYGKPCYQHFLSLMKLMFPDTDITPSIADAVMFFCLGYGFKKILNLIGCQNAGKCLKVDEEVRLLDGGLKRADEVRVGDILMGPDSTGRTVLNTCSGTRRLFTIVPTTGRPFTVTENHLVTVVCKRGKKNNGGKTWSSNATPGELYEFTAEELFNMPDWKRDNFGVLTAEIQYEEKELEVDPYIYGAWLGDGSKESPRFSVHSSEHPLLDELVSYWEGEGFTPKFYTKKGTEVYQVSFTTAPGQKNPFLTFIQSSVKESKFIREEYLKASIAQRLELLAGVIDTDGHLNKSYYEVSCSDPALMDGYEELANSLGFRTSRKAKVTNYLNTEGVRLSTEILTICGDITRIPVRLERKKAVAPKAGKGVRKHGVSGFRVLDHGPGDYAGFEVGGDHRFLLKDGTITHNSAGASRILFVCMFIDPENTVGYVANPFDNAADSTVWGDILELWTELCEHYPVSWDDQRNVLFPKGKVYAAKSITFLPGIPKAGFIELRNVKHTGKYKGTKTKGKQTTRGFLIVLIDEINEIDNMSFLTTIENIASQRAFFAITSQNFKSEDDMGGVITQPVPKYGGPGDFEHLDIEEDQYWHSAKFSITLRFDGHRSPNIKAGRTIYPYLFDRQDIERLRESGGGEQSIIYYSQARSFPVRGTEANSILPKARYQSSRAEDQHYQLIGGLTAVSFCDPAFGGRDSAVWGFARFGLAKILDAEGKEMIQEILVFADYMKKLSLVKNAVYNEYWFDRLKDLGLPLNDFHEGDPVSMEDQVAIQCAELNKGAGVAPTNFGYDFSMKPGIVNSMNRLVGFQSEAFDYNIKPLGYFLQSIRKNTLDCCKSRNTELAFLAADVFQTKQVRGGQFINAARVQLTRTTYQTKNGVYVAEDKPSYKARWNNVSPDERDTLMGVVAMAHKAGFRKQDMRDQARPGGSEDSSWDTLIESGFGRTRERAY